MMNFSRYLSALLITLWATASPAADIGYSGRLTDATGKPRSGVIDLEFSFFDDGGIAGTQLGTTINLNNVPLTQGVFAVTLALPDADTATVFGGAETWLQIKDLTNNKKLPRQRFLPVPLALRVPVDGTTLTYVDGKMRMGPVTPAVPSFLKIDEFGILSWEVGGGNSVGMNLVAESSIQNNAVTLAKLNNDAVDGSKIVDGSIENADIAALDGGKLTGTVDPARFSAYADLTAEAKIGTGAAQVAAGDDARFTDARTPSGAAGGKLSGTYPNPGINLVAGDIPTLNAAKISDFATATAAAETDPQVGANTTDYLSKWNGSALVASGIYENGGNVGIGTTSPVQELDVVKNYDGGAMVRAANNDSGSNARAGFVGFSDTSNFILQALGSGKAAPLTSSVHFSSGVGNSLHLGAAGGTSLSIEPTNGFVGIGTTAPAALLNVNGTGSTTAIFQREDNSDVLATGITLRRARADAAAPGANFGTQLLFDLEGFTDGVFPVAGAIRTAWEVPQTNTTTDRDSYMQLRVMRDSTNIDALRISSDGNVGIGTTGPTQIVHAYKASGGLALLVEDGGSTGASVFLKNSTRSWNLSNDAAGNFQIFDASAAMTRVLVNSSGNVGIGTAAPTAKLHVSGTAGVDGIKFPDGTLQTTAASGGGSEEYYRFVDEKTSGNNGGGVAVANAWETRTINNQKHADGSAITLASNQLTFAAGIYRCQGSAPSYDTGMHVVRLRDITNTADVLVGTPEFNWTGDGNQSRSFFSGKFTVTTAATMEIQHRNQYDGGEAYDLGIPAAMGVPETYAIIECWKF